jgi:hypothetical protein
VEERERCGALAPARVFRVSLWRAVSLRARRHTTTTSLTSCPSCRKLAKKGRRLTTSGVRTAGSLSQRLLLGATYQQSNMRRLSNMPTALLGQRFTAQQGGDLSRDDVSDQRRRS